MSLIVAILGIGVLIFVHEYGHYLACLVTKTRTETFSIGFGPRLFGWERGPGQPRRFTSGKRTLPGPSGAMDFRVSLIPLGGYVKMAGENPGEKSGAPDEYGSKPARQRAFIAVAGVVMNVLAAFVLYFVAMASGYSPEPAVVGNVEPGMPAANAGLQPGDRVLSMNGHRVETFHDLRIEGALMPRDEAAPVVVERDGARRTLHVTVSSSGELGHKLGVAPASTLVVEQDGRSVEIGPFQDADVDGRPVRGGTAAGTRVLEAIRSGAERVGITPVGGVPFVLDLPGARPDEAAKPVRRLGVEAQVRWKVAGARGHAAALLQPGDVLLRAVSAGREVELDTSQGLDLLRTLPGADALVVRRGEEEKTLPLGLPPGRPVEDFVADVDLSAPETTGGVIPLEAENRHAWNDALGTVVRTDRPAAREAGIRRGDRIVSVAGRPIAEFPDIAPVMDGLASDDPIEVVVESGNEKRTLSVRPARQVPLEGIAVRRELLEERVAAGVGDAFVRAFPRTGGEITSIFRQIGAFFSGKISFKENVAGPVTIVSSSGDIFSDSALRFLWFLAYISITLAVLNVLPVPLLDGGHLLFIAIEKVKGRPLREATIAKLQTVGLVLLLVLMFFALSNDIRFLSRK